MRGSSIGLILLLWPSFVLSLKQQDLCFKRGECKQSFPIVGKVVESQYFCRQECQLNNQCNWFTFYKKASYCQLYKNCDTLDEQFCPDCLSGEKDCVAPEIKCWLTGKCEGEATSVNTTQTSEECLELCQDADDCNWFTFDERKTACHLFKNCSSLVGCDTCVSGNSRCDPESKEHEWHLIFGGAGSPNTVELFNWKTYEQCQLPNLPVGVYGHVAEVFEGTPVFCEGGKYKKTCYKMDKPSRKWVSIASLLAGVEYGKSVIVPSQGWAVFGTLGNSLTKAQLLPSLDGEWKEGPNLPAPGHHAEKQCLIKINDVKSGFVYLESQPENYYHNRYNYYLRMRLFDWSTMSSEQPKTISSSSEDGPKSYSACSTINADDKKKMIYLASNGYLSSIEMENFSARENLAKPPKNMDLASEISSFSQLIAFNNKTELLLYGGQVGDEILDGIYKFSLTTKLWTKVGTMIHPRASHAVLPVQGLSCP